jgi:hypothetical protein
VTSKTGRAFHTDPDQLGELSDERSDVVIIGGMGSENDQVSLANAYADAAVQLTESAIASGEPWQLCYPILYLCRHALELYLKAAVPQSKPRHNLQPLVLEFEKLIRDQLGVALPVHLRADLLTLASIDPDGQGFRYATTNSGAMVALPGEYWVSLGDLIRLMNVVGTGVAKALDRL